MRLLVISAISIVYWTMATGCAGNAPKSRAPVENSPEVSAAAVNINTASAAELEKLPGVGAQTARGIVEHREKFGRFRRAEHLILVRGMSDKKFRSLRTLVKIQ